METDQGNVQQSAVTETSNPATPAAAAPVPEAPKQKIGEPRPKTGVAPGTEPPPAAPSYQPNYKFKAHGKEHEIPELLRGVMKDKDTEKYVHDLFEKAYGLGPIKQRFQETREELQSVKQELGGVMEQVTEARTAYQRNDIDSMLDIFQIPHEKMLQWAVEKVQLSQMPPEQRNALEGKRELERKLHEQEKSYRSTSQEQMQVQQEHLRQMLELTLERPDFTAAAQAYDTRKGKEGAFKDLVIQVGKSEWALNQKHLTPLEAAQKALELLGGIPAAPEKAAATPPAQATPAAPAQTAKKTLPNLTGAGAKASSAPAKAPMKSLDDLKRRYDEIAAQK